MLEERCVFSYFLILKIKERNLFLLKKIRRKEEEEMKSIIILIIIFSILIIHFLFDSYNLKKELNEKNIEIRNKNQEINELKEKIKQFEDKIKELKELERLKEIQKTKEIKEIKEVKEVKEVKEIKKTWAENLIGKISYDTTTIIKPLYSIEELQIKYDLEYSKNPLNKNITLSILNNKCDTKYGNISIKATDHRLRVDDIVHGYQYIFEGGALFTYTNFLGVSMQQDPSDAFALMDLIWRLKPDLIIELGTAGGGSAFFYGIIMTAYNPNAHIITLDPMRLQDWNVHEVKKVCSHCISGKETALWNSDTIHFLHKNPCDKATLDIIDGLIERWNSSNILVIEDSNHLTKTVQENLFTYSKYVSLGSYFIVQDMKMGRLYTQRSSPPLAVEKFLKSEIGQDFEVDRTFEYYIYTQHAKGFLKRIRKTL